MQQSQSSCGLGWPCLSVVLCSTGAAPENSYKFSGGSPRHCSFSLLTLLRPSLSPSGCRALAVRVSAAATAPILVPEDQVLAIIHRAKALGITHMVRLLSCLLVCGLGGYCEIRSMQSL